MTKLTDDKNASQQGMNIDIEHLSVGGNLVFAGRDGQVNVHTGGSVEQHTSQTITVGGVETTRDALESMVTVIQQVNKKIEHVELDDDTKEAAHHDLKTLEEQLTSIKKPNAQILVNAARSLCKFSPVLASGVVALFGEPLAAQIIAGVGGVAVQFYNVLMQKKAKS